MNRYVVLYLATLFVILPLDFLFLGVVARDFFTSQVGNMLGELKLMPAILFYLVYVVGILIYVAGAAQALELDGRDRRCVLGRVRDGGRLDRRMARGELAGAEGLRRCSTVW